MTDPIGYLAVTLCVAGMLLLARHSPWGWFVHCAGILCWLTFALLMRSGPLLADALVYVGVDVYGAWRWFGAGHV